MQLLRACLGIGFRCIAFGCTALKLHCFAALLLQRCFRAGAAAPGNDCGKERNSSAIGTEKSVGCGHNCRIAAVCGAVQADI